MALQLALLLAPAIGCSPRDREPARRDTAAAAAPEPASDVGTRHVTSRGDTCTVSAGPGTPATNQELGVPEGPASVRGLVTSVVPGTGAAAVVRVLIEGTVESGRGARGSGSPVVSRFMVAVPADARVMQRVGHRAAPHLLAVCHAVSAWFTGPVAESEPAQAVAAAVVIERVLEHRR